jgi:hypothetical protein
MTTGEVSLAATTIADRLDEHGIDYAIGGALALAAHGMPRMTTDVDIGVFVDRSRLGELYDALERAGCLFDRARADRDVARMSFFSARRGRAPVDIFVSFHPHHDDARARRVRLPGPDGTPRWFLSAEDLMVHKLAMLRARDLADVERLFAVLGPALDLAYVRRWVEAIAPDPSDRRRAALDDLERRFGP